MNPEPFTDNQLELVEQAMLESSFGNGSAKDVMAKLRKKPATFANGQVLVHKGRDGNLTFVQWGNTLSSPAGLEALNQQEVGPDYVPRAEFEKVESALEVAFRGVEDIRDSNDAYWSQGRATAVLKKIREIMEIPQ